MLYYVLIRYLYRCGWWRETTEPAPRYGLSVETMVYFLCKTTVADAIPGRETVGGSWLCETVERPDRSQCNGRGNGYDQG